MGKRWTEGDDGIIKKYWQEKSGQAIAKLLGRSVIGVRCRARKLGFQKKKMPNWSSEEAATLKLLWESQNAIEVSQTLHRSVGSIYRKVFKLNLKGGNERAGLEQRKGRMVQCAICGLPVYRKLSHLKERNYCSLKCQRSVLNYTRENQRKAAFANSQLPTKPELALLSLLQANYPGEYVYNGDFGNETMLHGLIPDFVNVNGKKQVIELFGDYWHDKKKNVPWKSTEFGRKAVYSQLGFDCLVIWEHELNSPETVVERIREFNK